MSTLHARTGSVTPASDRNADELARGRSNPPGNITGVDTPLGTVPHVGTSLPGPKAAAYIERDERHSSPSYTRDWPLVVDRAAGLAVQDVDGNRFLDFAAGIAVCATGHCHPQVVKAIEEQSKKLLHICGSDFYYPSMVELMERLASIVPGPD
jgi:4-aminobutyrate aminotransferase